MKKNIAKQTFWLKICKTQKNQIKVLLPIYRLCIKLKKIATFLLKLIQGMLLVEPSKTNNLQELIEVESGMFTAQYVIFFQIK